MILPSILLVSALLPLLAMGMGDIAACISQERARIVARLTVSLSDRCVTWSGMVVIWKALSDKPFSIVSIMIG